jgi:hypothetical protein
MIGQTDYVGIVARRVSDVARPDLRLLPRRRSGCSPMGHATSSRSDSMKSITRLMVLNLGSRPALKLQTNLGSFRARVPNAVGVVPVRSRKRLISVRRVSAGLSMIVIIIVRLLSRQ